MAARAAEIPESLPPVAQVKLVLMTAIVNRIERSCHDWCASNGSSVGMWAHAAEKLEIPYESLSRLRTGRYEKFSVSYLLDLCDSVGVSIQITAL